jgi:hypothetical protein
VFENCIKSILQVSEKEKTKGRFVNGTKSSDNADCPVLAMVNMIVGTSYNCPPDDTYGRIYRYHIKKSDGDLIALRARREIHQMLLIDHLFLPNCYRFYKKYCLERKEKSEEKSTKPLISLKEWFSQNKPNLTKSQQKINSKSVS